MLTLFSVAALRCFGDRLSDFERSEIIDFVEIWFLGLEAKKILGVRGAAQNHGKKRAIENWFLSILGFIPSPWHSRWSVKAGHGLIIMLQP